MLIAPTMEAAVMVVRTLSGVTGGLAAGHRARRARADRRPLAQRVDGSPDGVLRARLARAEARADGAHRRQARAAAAGRRRRRARRRAERRAAPAAAPPPKICAAVARMAASSALAARSRAAPRLHVALALRLLPFLAWRDRITRATLRADSQAGLVGALVVLPQGVAYATLAGLPPQYGLYCAMVPAIVAALWGSSWHQVSGPDQRDLAGRVRDGRAARGARQRRLHHARAHAHAAGRPRAARDGARAPGSARQLHLAHRRRRVHRRRRPADHRRAARAISSVSPSRPARASSRACARSSRHRGGVDPWIAATGAVTLVAAHRRASGRRRAFRT